MIGYVLLISAAVFMSFIVYTWMKSYVPKDKPECPADTSIIITKAECDGEIITIDINNNGLFSIKGYILTGITNNGEIVDLSDGFYGFASGDLMPGDPVTSYNHGAEFPVESKKGVISTIIDKIELVPIREETSEEGQIKTAICGDAKVSKKFDARCSVKIGAS